MSNGAERSLKQGDEPIEVLLVDDNERWATFVAGELERDEPTMTVMVAASATEALLTLKGTGRVDCVVTDYLMPEITGLELLDRIRDGWDRIPAILMTGEGSEDVAARAIAAGVSDYLMKDPRSDQTSLLATKIRSAVTRYRLRLAVEESEERYRTVTEQSRDAILIWQDSQVVFCNQGLETLVGAPRADIIGAEFDWEVIQSDDQDRIQGILSRWNNGEVDDETHPVRLQSTDGDDRYCEFTGREITHNNERAVLVTVHDLTRRKRRERAHERERRINRTIQELLISARSREEFERSFVHELVEDRYTLVWIGERRNESVLHRSAAGETGYLDHLLPEADGDDHADDPVLLAARSGNPQFVENMSDLVRTDWSKAALECGLKSAAGLPLQHNDVTFGILGVYANAEYAFDDVERRLLTELADTLAFAIHNFERDRTLASNHTGEATIRIDGSGHYLAAILSTLEGTTGTPELTVQGTISRGSGRFIQYLMLNGIVGDRFEAGAETDPRVESTNVIGPERHGRVQVVTAQQPPEAILATMGAIVRSTTVTADAATVRFEISAKRQLREVVDGLEDYFESVSVESIHQRDRTSPTVVPRYVDTSTLTEKQETALRAAFHQGYFERPRVRSAEEIATSLDIAHSTFLQHLRIGERKVFASLFG